MFSKKRRRKSEKSKTAEERSARFPLPRTVYLMNAEELYQTALLFLTEDSTSTGDAKTDTRASPSREFPAVLPASGEKDDRLPPVSGEGCADQAVDPPASPDENSLDELFLQDSAWKPPPKNNRKNLSKGLSSIDSTELDECTLLSPRISPASKTSFQADSNRADTSWSSPSKRRQRDRLLTGCQEPIIPERCERTSCLQKSSVVGTSRRRFGDGGVKDDVTGDNSDRGKSVDFKTRSPGVSRSSPGGELGLKRRSKRESTEEVAIKKATEPDLSFLDEIF